MPSWARLGDVVLVVFLVLVAAVSVAQLRLNAMHHQGPHDRPVASATPTPRR